MLDQWTYRNVCSAIKTIFPHYTVIFYNGEQLFKISRNDSHNNVILFTLDGINFSITHNNNNILTTNDLWFAVQQFCQIIFTEQVKQVIAYISVLE